MRLLGEGEERPQIQTPGRVQVETRVFLSEVFAMATDHPDKDAPIKTINTINVFAGPGCRFNMPPKVSREHSLECGPVQTAKMSQDMRVDVCSPKHWDLSCFGG